MLVDFSHSSDGFGYGTDGQLSKRFGKNHIELHLGFAKEGDVLFSPTWQSGITRF